MNFEILYSIMTSLIFELLICMLREFNKKSL